MNTITIPRDLIKNDDLVIIARKKYEEFLRMFSRQKTESVNDNLAKAFQEARQGKIVGPFDSVNTLRQSLEK